MAPVLITAVCPSCETSFKVDPSLRGKQIRCPNPQCRAVFTVGPETPPPPASDGKRIGPETPPPPASDGKRTGVVGDMVPLLSVEAEAAASSWQSPPPIRRPTNTAVPATQVEPEPAPAPAVRSEPRETKAPAIEPPPVRRAPETKAVEAPPEPPVHQYDPPPARGKRLVWVVAAFALGVALLLTVGGYFVWTQIIYTESSRAKTADADYNARNYSKAAEGFNELANQFPNSVKHPYYVLMQQLSELRSQAGAPSPEILVVLKGLDDFIDAHKEKDAALLKDRAPDLGDAIGDMAKSFAANNAQPKDDAPLEIARRLEASLTKVTELDAAVPSAALGGAISKNIRTVRQAIALNQKVRDGITQLKTAAELLPAARAVREFLHQFKKLQAALPEIAQEPEVSQLRELVYGRHMDGIHYIAAGIDQPAPVQAADEKRTPSLLVDALVKGGMSARPAEDSVVLAVVRGVLYALDRADGQIKWWVRVGVDTTDLPVRVPAAVGIPERILVVSADAKTVTALDSEGAQVWQYRIDAECLGRPLIVDQLAYLATYDGKVHEIELSRGKLLGIFDLGQPLTVGGVRDPNTNLLYFPADEFCVYVLDVSQQPKRCVAVLYTDHPAGSLRSAPLILSAPDAEGADSQWLVLNQVDGLHSTRLHVYHLPIADRNEPAEKLNLKPISGWTWFPPYYDSEKVAMLGDAGELAVLGIRQLRNPKDPLLFPMPTKYFEVGAASTATDAHSRAEIAAVRDRDYWLLADGELKRLFLELTAKEGPRMKPAAGWDAPQLGSPLQAAQLEKGTLPSDASLILVTQPTKRQTCLATAVNEKDGKILWQRQLGFVCWGEPLALRPAGDKGPPVLLALDRGGGLFAFDPGRLTKLQDSEWHEINKALAEALDDGPSTPPILLPTPDGQAAYEVACPGDGKKLVIRYVTVEGGGLRVDAERSITIDSPLAGTPIVTDSMMVLPLANGVLARLTLPLEPKPELAKGPNWNTSKSPQGAVCRLTALGTNTFLASDGGSGLTCWQWTAPANYIPLPKDKDPDKPTLVWSNGSLTADPVPLSNGKGWPRIVGIADVTDAVTLITVEEDGHSRRGKSWNLSGQLTAGPFVEDLPGGATRLACVVNHHHLVWIDPEKKEILWSYPQQGNPGPALVGRPRLVGGVVVVADESGLIVGIDPEKGTPVGKPFHLPGSTVPAASPVAFGDDRLFAPLSDGTVLLPPLKRLRP